ncbi:peptide deformylase, mitochondrial [Rhinichthys klamathensis goyatoka]|uniref:peptide deformylase, mitochondrial n=1 Tax=Rhinichthys klamathensis goyatoka TaxID=3034132 RepID=UPI0024B569BB|nr:peptide deformylase, mitochondrial [Rhinichthys klamathensis goyatoka]
MIRHWRTFSHCVLRSQTNYVLPKPVRILLPLSPLTCTASPRTHSTNIKMRSYLQYMKRKVKGAPAPPYNHVCQVGDPVLRSQAAAVEPGAIQGPEVQKVIKTLVKVMRTLECVGLSAPQIGVPLRILALEYPTKMLEESSITSIEARGLVAVPLMIFVNPQLRVLDGHTVIFQEACESICGYSASVPRYVSVEVSGLNEKAEPVSWQASGWPARILQHEMDHLNGVLYIDRMDSKTFINVKWEEYNE